VTSSECIFLVRGLISPWIIGKSELQALVALSFMLVVALISLSRSTKRQSRASSFVLCYELVLLGLVAAGQLILHLQYAETSRSNLFHYSVAVVDGYESSNSLWHSHVVKCVGAWLLSSLGWRPSELRGDVGYSFLYFIPSNLVVGYGAIASLFVVTILYKASNLLLDLLARRLYLSALLSLVVSAAVAKMPLDGGVFNGRSAACFSILLFYQAYASTPTFPDRPRTWTLCIMAVIGAVVWSCIPLWLGSNFASADWVDASTVEVLCAILPVAAVVAIERSVAQLSLKRLLVAALSLAAALYSIRALPWYSNDLRFALTQFSGDSWISVLEYDASVPSVTNLAPFPRLTTTLVSRSETGLTLQERFQLRPGIPAIIQTSSACELAPPYHVFVEFLEIESITPADVMLPWYIKNMSIISLHDQELKRAEFSLSACLPYPDGPPVPLLRAIAVRGSRVFVVRGTWYRGDRPSP
jgi:hypothetical protein